MKTLANKTVLLTGASRGIGTFIAHELAKKQATVVCVSRSQAGLDQVCAEINAMGGKGIRIPFDISNIEELPNLVEKIEKFAGSVDILINNAGIEKYRAFQNYSLADIQSVLSINLVAAIELTRLVLPTMLHQRSGHIVNIASLAAKKGHPYDSIYSASKAGLLMWADAIRQELVTTGVGISTICPGYISDYGLLADTGVPAPSLVGSSKSKDVAIAVIRAIEKNQPEVIVNGNFITENITKFLFAIEQFFPTLGDKINNLIGVTKLNQKRIKNLSNDKYNISDSILVK
ncbi:SDR family NAD(P)-dependent oxidoreductase [Nostoc sp. FACHB-152]|uniref:SDR family NAD(P)-dependent oxidoreductase n=1 Tax=unclassified Nostoc TaxID=2593658 RepID=UPI00168852F7|nr:MULTISPECIES: SDR family NAD(P)-dependent oxidoreductase [unclassified Nostoc]MBD2448805.1 SDR family NAD(P)-dependent oxidoreductase [Nostoc sp. FACHB-152]MBD2467585.1 SDR family NAD(P)-dependent oxidoreductase [Nostoc sp. FACHB-145]